MNRAVYHFIFSISRRRLHYLYASHHFLHLLRRHTFRSVYAPKGKHLQMLLQTNIGFSASQSVSAAYTQCRISR